MERLQAEHEERLSEVEESLALALLQIDLLKNKTTTGGLSKSIATIDGMLSEIRGQRERIATQKRLNPLVPVMGLIAKAFDLEEMNELIYVAGFKPEDVPTATTARARAQKIVEYFDRQGQMPVLLMTAKNLRPGELWPEE